MITVTKLFSFEACHYLPNYIGKCHDLHGHSYKLEVTVSGDIKKSGATKGMIIDFKELKEIVNKAVVDKYDHSLLNEFFNNPTAEIMVESIGKILYPLFKEKDCILLSVKLWETVNSYAEYKPEYESLGDILRPAF